jgi:hypothetical protein
MTLGEIATALGKPPAQVHYLLAKVGAQPVTRIGIVRLFGPQIIEVLRREISRKKLRKKDRV